MPATPTLFVAGAGGKLGRAVVEMLLERGYAGKIIAGSRHPEKLSFSGVETRKADFTDPAGFAGSLAGVDRVLLVSTSAVGVARIKQHTDAVAAASAAGVRRIVYTSMPHPEPGSIIPMAADHYATEQAIKASGVDYTILRNSWYTENLLGSLPAALASGKWYSSSGDGRISYVTREDTARAAAGALLADDVGNRVFTITGPEALTVRELAAIASEVAGRPIEVVNVSDAQFTAGMQQAGLSPELAGLLTSLEIGQRRGALSMVTDAVETLWGDKPTSVREFLSANKAALVPSA